MDEKVQEILECMDKTFRHYEERGATASSARFRATAEEIARLDKEGDILAEVVGKLRKRVDNMLPTLPVTEVVKNFAEHHERLRNLEQGIIQGAVVAARLAEQEEEMERFRKEYRSNRDNDLENIQYFVGNRLAEQDKRIAAFVHSDAMKPEKNEDDLMCYGLGVTDGVHRLAEAMEIDHQHVVWVCCDCGRQFEPEEMRKCSLAQLKEMGVLR